MTDTRSAPEAATIDATALGRWMDAVKLPGDGVPALTRLSGGSQNELFVVERDGIRAVLRIPPATPPRGRGALRRPAPRVAPAARAQGRGRPASRVRRGRRRPRDPRRAVL